MNNYSTPIPRQDFSVQNLSHEFLASMELGYLVPVNWFEMLPNDRLKNDVEAFIRFAPLQYPVLSRINLKLFHFFVPTRLVWKYWEKFIAEDKLSNIGTSRRTKPYQHINVLFGQGKYYPGSLADYMGLPMAQFFSGAKGQDGKFENDLIPLGRISDRIDVLPFLAYQKIYNDWFRNENIDEDIFNTDTDDEEIRQDHNLQNVVESEGVVSSPFLDELFTLRKKAWERDYFTSCLPTPQYGEPAGVTITPNDNARGTFSYDGDAGWTILRDASNGRVISPQDATEIYTKDGNTYVQLNNGGLFEEVQVNIDNSRNLQMALEGAFSFTINDFRLASSIQRYNEAVMRAGHRYIEYIKAMYNMVTPDYRLQRPELLGARNVPITIQDIAQTSESTGTSAQGQLAGNAYGYCKGSTVRYTAREHGFFFTLACIIPRTVYANGLPRAFTRWNRLDYHNRYFELLGDQEVRNKEIFLGEDDGNPGNLNDDTFGYQIRFAEYKSKPSTIHGEFTNNLDFFTLTRMFAERPALNADFIRPDDETLNRAFAVRRGTDHLYSQFFNKTIMRRPMQDNPLPKII